MDHQPQDSRRQAAHKFVDALDELETVFKSESTEATRPQQSEPDTTNQARSRRGQAASDALEGTDFGRLLDDAVQDIEQFMATEESANQPDP